MTASATQLLGNKGVISAKQYQLHFGANAKMFPIHSLQCRAGQHGIPICCNTSLDQFAQIFQSRPPIVVRQRNTAVHLLDVGRWMKIVCLIEVPAELSREQLADSSFART